VHRFGTNDRRVVLRYDDGRLDSCSWKSDLHLLCSMSSARGATQLFVVAITLSSWLIHPTARGGVAMGGVPRLSKACGAPESMSSPSSTLARTIRSRSYETRLSASSATSWRFICAEKEKE
jgi:hypothetical protein